MPDPAQQLQQLYIQGFDLQPFERYPKVVGVLRGECVAILLPLPDGIQILGSPGWRIGDEVGVLVQKGGRKVFQWKGTEVEATEERLGLLAEFLRDLKAVLTADQSPAAGSAE